MDARMAQYGPRRRSAARRTIVAGLVVLVVLGGGWGALWYYAAGKAQTRIEAWREREAKAGRIYSCEQQTIGGFPFGFAIDCARASALLRSGKPPLELNIARILVAIAVYEPDQLVSTFAGPLTLAEPGQRPTMVADWTSFQSRVRGTPAEPQGIAVAFEQPRLDRIDGGTRRNMLTAKRIELTGRIIEGSAAHKPVIETVLHVVAASAPELGPAAVQPADADIRVVLRGLDSFSPQPWSARLRQLQAAGGTIEVTQARAQQGQTLAVGQGTLALNSEGHLQGDLQVTVAGIEPFLAGIGVQQQIQTSKPVDKIAGALDRILPGLGKVAREKAGANLSLGLNLLGKHTTLEGRDAVILPLQFNDGKVFLGPIPIGNTPALF